MAKNNIISAISIFALSSAFLLVCVLYFFLGSSSKRILNYKIKLGAIILSLSASCVSCAPVRTCYKPAIKEESEVSIQDTEDTDKSDPKSGKYQMKTYTI